MIALGLFAMIVANGCHAIIKLRKSEMTALNLMLRLCDGLICNHIATKERDDCFKFVSHDGDMGRLTMK